LARTKLIEIETMKDPALREAARAEWLKSLKAELQKLNIFEDAQVRQALQKRNLSDLIGELGEAIARTLLRGEYPSSKGYTVLSNLELVQEVKGFRSIAEWQAAEQAKGPNGNPNDIGGLYEKNGKLWKSITEVDGMVVKRSASGQLRPVEMEQVKTGQKDSPTAAELQNEKALNALKDIAAGNPDTKIFERPGKNTLGKEITGNFDLSGTDSIKTTTRGLPGKGFTKEAPYSREVLQHVAESLLKDGLPPAGPQTIPPLTSPEKKEEKREVLVP
jgi:hypothetical protein